MYSRAGTQKVPLPYLNYIDDYPSNMNKARAEKERRQKMKKEREMTSPRTENRDLDAFLTSIYYVFLNLFLRANERDLGMLRSRLIL